MRRAMLIVAALVMLAAPARAADRFDALVQPYAGLAGFSGSILVVKDGSVLFDRAYGFSDAEHRTPNLTTTRFHIGTLSMIYTAAVVLRLVELHRINLDNTAGQFVAGLSAEQGASSIQGLLAVKPDAPDAAASYALLARIAAAASGKSFADTADNTAFASVLLTGTGIDDGTLGADSRMAKGYHEDGTLVPPPDWAPLTGSASAYTTTRGEFHWLEMLFGGKILTTESREILLAGPWNKALLGPPNAPVAGYDAQGSAPGFASYVLWLPGLTVIVLANAETRQIRDIGVLLALQALRGDALKP